MPMREPQTRAQVWRRFLLWVAGVPVVVLAAGAVIWAALWLSGGDLVWQAVSGMGTALFWIAAITLMYPAIIWVWSLDLREGLKTAADWDALTEAERAARRAAPVTKGKRAAKRGRA